MSRLTGREMEEIRRVKRAAREEAREEFSQVRPADDIDTRQTASAPTFLAALAHYSGLAEIAWMVRHGVVLPIRRRLEKRQVMAELRALNDRALRDIGIERGQIELVVDAMKIEAPRSPRPAVGPFAALRRWRYRRRTINALAALDDRLLDDIGLVRANIGEFVRSVDKAVVSGRIEGRTAAQKIRHVKTPLDALRQWDLSRRAASDMARLDPEALADLGYVKGDVDWVPEVLAQRKLNAA
jgi:uncharacterized protein YjiS (DUF1127 family)